MAQSSSRLRLQMSLAVALILVLVWSGAVFELYRSHQTFIHDAEVRTSVQAQVFAEYSRSTLKRINEFILDTRGRWTGDWMAFSTLVKQTQENIDDITFQVSVIDKEGILAFSNLAKPTDRTDLSTREHYRVHKDAPGADRLFISKPILGKISGKWSIQVTRPILHNRQMDGVVVISVGPEQFTSFAEKLHPSEHSAISLVRDSGEIMARYPINVSSLGKIIKEAPYLRADSPVSGNFHQTAIVDGVERIYGFYRLPEYGLSFVLGEAIDDVLATYYSHRRAVFAIAVFISLLVIISSFMLLRSFDFLEEVRHQLDAIFDLSPDGFVSFDRRRRVKYVSPAFTRMTGLEGSEIVGLDEKVFAGRLHDLCSDHARFPGMEPLRSRLLDRSVNSANADTVGRQLIEVASSGRRVIEVLLRLSDAKKVSQILYFRDITRETEVDQMKSEFLSTAAHELRTPMASIFGFAELLLTHAFDESNRQEFLGIIYRQAELMSSILNELLDLARIEARQGKDFVIKETEVQGVVAEVVSGFKLPEGRTAPVIISSPAASLSILADSKKASQAILNVLSNAYKYSPEGGSVEIELIASALGSLPMVGIRVIDHGIGMTQEQEKRVSERFYRADASGKIPGTGLGMSIVKEIVALHHGQMEIRSKVAQGTCVTLWFPEGKSRPESVQDIGQM